MLEHIGELGLLAADVEGDDDRPQPRGGEQRHHELAAVAEQECDPVTAADAAARKSHGNLHHLLFERLPGEPLLAADKGLAFGIAPHRFTEKLIKAARPVGKAAHQAVTEVRLVSQHHVFSATAPRSMTNTRSSRPCAWAAIIARTSAKRSSSASVASSRRACLNAPRFGALRWVQVSLQKSLNDRRLAVGEIPLPSLLSLTSDRLI